MALHFTEVRFASLLSGGVTTMAVINPPEMALANRTSLALYGCQDYCIEKTTPAFVMTTNKNAS